MWNKPYSLKEGSAITVGLMLIGLILQFTIGPLEWGLFYVARQYHCTDDFRGAPTRGMATAEALLFLPLYGLNAGSCAGYCRSCVAHNYYGPHPPTA